MAENEPIDAKSGVISPAKPAETRAPRSIRFSDSEWASVEKEAKARGLTAAELVRHAVVSVATGKLATDSPAVPSEIVAQIERIYRGVYLLSTLKRDAMIREGREDELERVAADASESQAAIRNEATKAS